MTSFIRKKRKGRLIAVGCFEAAVYHHHKGTRVYMETGYSSHVDLEIISIFKISSRLRNMAFGHQKVGEYVIPKIPMI